MNNITDREKLDWLLSKIDYHTGLDGLQWAVVDLCFGDPKDCAVDLETAIEKEIINDRNKHKPCSR